MLIEKRNYLIESLFTEIKQGYINESNIDSETINNDGINKLHSKDFFSLRDYNRI